MNKSFIVLALLISSVGLTGCKDPYGATAKAGQDIGTGITQGMQTVSQLAMAGTISNAEALNVLGYLEFANQGDEAFIACVGGAHNGGNKIGTYTFCANAFNSTLNTPAELALIHVSNTGASATINTIVKGLSSAVSLIVTQLGGA